MVARITFDKVFLLSREEFERYFSTRRLGVVFYNEGFGDSFWWLRTLERQRFADIASGARQISNAGSFIGSTHIRVRPAIWILL